MHNHPGLPVAAAALSVLLLAMPASAVDFGGAALHGYASQTYMQTTANQYLDADTKGTWDNNFLGLVATLPLNDRSKLWAQLEASTTDSTRFTWFFVDYQFSDDLRAHAGRVKFPLGLYNEIIDAKYLHVTSLEPLLYQQAADFVHDSYTGVGLDYDRQLGSAGAISWQIYGGNSYDTDPPPGSRDRRMFGGRVTYTTPIDGLRAILSAYHTDVQLLVDGHMIGEDRWIASVDYLHGNWNVKSEYGAHRFRGVSANAYYVQVERAFGSKWSLFGRYDDATLDEARRSDLSYFQRTLVVGCNYNLLSNVSLRLEDHINHGYALPVASEEVQPGMGRPNWQMVVAGVHVIF